MQIYIYEVGKLKEFIFEIILLRNSLEIFVQPVISFFFFFCKLNLVGSLSFFFF